jgi:phosphate uptake regulator
MASVDAKSLAKTVGEASARFAKTSKTVSRDLERAGDQAERIGKILK